MTRDSRVADPITRTGRAPVVDIVAPPRTADPADALAALIPHVPGASDYTEAERELIRRHARAKRVKSEAEAKAKALVPDIAKMLAELIEMKERHQIAPKEWEAVLDGHGFELRPFEFRQVWPRYRDDPATDAPYEREDLVEAIRAAGYPELVVEAPHKDEWPKLLRSWVKAWRQRCGRDGLHDEEGQLVDHWGDVLQGSELDDPTADILAVPQILRRVIEPVETLDIRYTRAEVAPEYTADAPE